MLDRLWELLVHEVRSGSFRLWLALVSHPAYARSASLTPTERSTLAQEVETALAIPASNPRLASLTGSLDGLELLLLQGVAPGEVREAYDRWWLSVLEEA